MMRIKQFYLFRIARTAAWVLWLAFMVVMFLDKPLLCFLLFLPLGIASFICTFWPCPGCCKNFFIYRSWRWEYVNQCVHCGYGIGDDDGLGDAGEPLSVAVLARRGMVALCAVFAGLVMFILVSGLILYLIVSVLADGGLVDSNDLPVSVVVGLVVLAPTLGLVAASRVGNGIYRTFEISKTNREADGPATR